MAFLRLSGLLTSITGKLNGSYFSQKKGATTMNRCGGKLTKADSGRVSLQRAQNNVSFVAGQWKNLTSGEKLAWSTSAGTLTWLNKAGMEYTPTGYEYFCSCNLNRLKMDNVIIATPLIEEPDNFPANLSIVFDTGSELVLRSTEATTTVSGVIVYASAPQSAGAARPKSGYKIIHYSDTIDSGDTVITGGYGAVFGYYPRAGNIFFKIEIMSTDSGVATGTKLNVLPAGF